MKKSDINPMPEYFERYINLVGDIELSEAFDESLKQIEGLDLDKLKKINGKIYAPDKWTVNTIIQHIIDFERILSYRALVFARRAGITPQSIDEQLLADNSNADRRNVTEVVEDLRIARLATAAMFESFDEEMLKTNGIIWKYEMPVLAMGFNIIGHQLHHFKVIEDKYFPLAD
jgi:hypothetical protein